MLAMRIGRASRNRQAVVKVQRVDELVEPRTITNPHVSCWQPPSARLVSAAMNLPEPGIVAKTRRLMRCAVRQRPLLALLGLVLGFSVLAPNFLSLANLLNVLNQAAPVGIVALGMTFVILAGQIDLSVGAVVALSGLAAGWADHQGMPWPIVLLIACGAGMLCGGASGIATGLIHVPSFISTLGMLSAVRGLALMMTEGRSLSSFSTSFLVLGNDTWSGIPVAVCLFVALALVCHVILNFTIWGRYILATGANRQAAFFSGIPVDRYTAVVFLISGGAAGIAGMALASRLASAHPLAGSLYELDAIAAVVIGGGSLAGGRASISGTVLGILILSVLKNGLSMLNVASYAQQITIGGILVLSAAMDSARRKQQM